MVTSQYCWTKTSSAQLGQTSNLLINALQCALCRLMVGSEYNLYSQVYRTSGCAIPVVHYFRNISIGEVRGFFFNILTGTRIKAKPNH